MEMGLDCCRRRRLVIPSDPQKKRWKLLRSEKRLDQRLDLSEPREERR